MNSPTAAPRLSERQRISWLRLIRTTNVGPASFRALINRFGSAEAALEMLPELTRSGGARRVSRIPTISEIEAELETAARHGARFVCIGEPEYPPLLKRVENPPPVIAVQGAHEVFQLPPVAIVGARNASASGMRIARSLASRLGQQGFGVVSGLARGIDTAAHQGSLATGTVAVLAGGLDRPYPPENVGLLGQITSGRGTAISEMPFGWEPRAQDFPRRNRIVAGLSFGLVVVEAAKRSGSLISARLAGEMGRLVFAVPGSPLDPRAEGANSLLKDGAILVTEAGDVIDAILPLTAHTPTGRAIQAPPDFSGLSDHASPDLGSSISAPASTEAHDSRGPQSGESHTREIQPPDNGDRARLTEALGPTPISVDELVRHTGLHPAQISMILLELDLGGRLERHSGGNVSIHLGDL